MIISGKSGIRLAVTVTGGYKCLTAKVARYTEARGRQPEQAWASMGLRQVNDAWMMVEQGRQAAGDKLRTDGLVACFPYHDNLSTAKLELDFRKGDSLGDLLAELNPLNVKDPRIGEILQALSLQAEALLEQRSPCIPEAEGVLRLREGEEERLGGPLNWVPDFDRRDIPTILELAQGAAVNLLERGLVGVTASEHEVAPKAPAPSGAEILLVETIKEQPDRDNLEFGSRRIMYNGQVIFEQPMIVPAEIEVFGPEPAEEEGARPRVAMWGEAPAPPSTR